MSVDGIPHQSLDKPEENANTSQRPGSTSSTRSKRSSSLQEATTTSAVPQTLGSPPYRLTRKRTATQLDSEIQELDDGEDRTPTHGRMASGESRDSVSTVCICQPDPKIPRPRNAFILYRQHHQAAIVAQNPGLANPDISKIIGEQWRQQSAEVKNEWKVLAEEEKIRHQQQYPEYRYQPRRNGRRGSTADTLASSSAVEKTRCAKCGGRSIVTPTTCSTPLSAKEALPSLPPPTPSSITPTSRYLPMFGNLSLASPALRRSRSARDHPLPAPLHLVTQRDIAHDDTLSPDTKRRRFNSGQYSQIPGRPGPGTPYYLPPPQCHQRRESFPRPEVLLSRQSPPAPGMLMGPPFRPMHTPRRDPSLILPPLQTGEHASKNTVERMVKGMSFLGKIRILGRIAPPFKRSTPTSPTSRSAPGPVIAIEGEDVAAVKRLTTWLEDFLAKEGDYHVKIVDGPKGPEFANQSSISDFISIVNDWHKTNSELIDFITTPHSSSPKDTASANLEAQPQPHPGQTDQDGDTLINDPPSASQHPSLAHLTPLLLLPLYTLDAANAYASAIPIRDAYSPADHWQWMATLFRSIIGPDLTIYVRSSSASGNGNGIGDGNGNGIGNGVLATAAEEKSVEVRLDYRAVVVNVAAGAGAGAAAGELDGATLRRVGFEIGEWIRGMGV